MISDYCVIGTYTVPYSLGKVYMVCVLVIVKHPLYGYNDTNWSIPIPVYSGTSLYQASVIQPPCYCSQNLRHTRMIDSQSFTLKTTMPLC